MALRHDQIDDFVQTTLPLFKRRAWTDISLEHQEYVAASIITDKNVTEAGGSKISFRVKVRNTGNARATGLFATDVTKIDDVMITGEVTWSYQTTNFSYDIYEDLWQSDKETIIRELQIREHDAMSDMAELTEQQMWSEPTSASDPNPYGIPFWFPMDASTTEDGGFNGISTSSGILRAGIDSTLYPRWRNWTAGYRSPNIDDLVRKVKRALTFTNFVPPVPHPELGYGESKYQIYTTYSVQEPLERIAETRNDRLGSDVARYMGQVTIGGTPMRWVPYLESNYPTQAPLYGINWKTFRPFVKRGVNMRRNPPKPAAKQHTVREVHYDNAMNYICTDLRRNFVISKI